MKTTLVIMIAALLLVSAIGAVSAVAPEYKTLIAGKVYDSPNFETANAVSNANILVTCNGYNETATSEIDGTYTVEFSPSEACYNTMVTVVAEKDGISNSASGEIQDYTETFDLYLGVVNIALIPEFGVIVGALTLIGAVGLFFIVRRK